MASVVLQVQACQVWNDSGLDVYAGEVVDFAATGLWYDARFESGPEGYRAPWWLRLSNPLRRCPDGGWFELIGEIEKGLGHIFPIGLRPSVVMPSTGRLFLYANDVRGFYGNNRGALEVKIDPKPR